MTITILPNYAHGINQETVTKIITNNSKQIIKRYLITPNRPLVQYQLHELQDASRQEVYNSSASATKPFIHVAGIPGTREPLIVNSTLSARTIKTRRTGKRTTYTYPGTDTAKRTLNRTDHTTEKCTTRESIQEHPDRDLGFYLRV